MRNVSLILILTFALSILAFSEYSKQGFWGKETIGAEKVPAISEQLKVADVSGFGISISTKRGAKVKLNITESKNQSIELIARPSIIEALKEEAEVDDSILQLRLKNKTIVSDLIINASIDVLEKIKLSGSGIVNTNGTFNSVDDLELKISGSGKMNLQLGTNCDEISSSISGSGDIILSGQCNSIEHKISGSGSLIADNLQSNNCSISIAGSGECKVAVEESLDVKISGSGDVCYIGNPKVDQRIAGSGKIRSCAF